MAIAPDALPELRECHRSHQTRPFIELAATRLEQVRDLIQVAGIGMLKELIADPASRGLDQLLSRRVVAVDGAQRDAGSLRHRRHRQLLELTLLQKARDRSEDPLTRRRCVLLPKTYRSHGM